MTSYVGSEERIENENVSEQIFLRKSMKFLRKNEWEIFICTFPPTKRFWMWRTKVSVIITGEKENNRKKIKNVSTSVLERQQLIIPVKTGTWRSLITIVHDRKFVAEKWRHKKKFLFFLREREKEKREIKLTIDKYKI